MVRFVLNAVGSVLLSVAVVFAVADIARSLADDAWRMTPVGEILLAIGVTTGARADMASPSSIDLLGLSSAWPASMTLAAAAFLVLFLGRSRDRTRRSLTR
ncbi:MAG: hypothetical protein H7Y08_06340 [Rhizobiaceae bacterium]|nr:hypothetical protein [Rhizobiaceae bacterium]